MTEKNDEQLMLAYGNGDSAAFTELYQRHKAPLYRYFLRQISSSARAEELYQETWIRVVDNRQRYQSSAKFTTWVYKIAHNLLVDEYRKESSHTHWLKQVQQEETEEAMTDEFSEAKKRAIKICVSSLPSHQREAFMLKHDSGFSREEICDIIAVKPETLKTRLRYALDQLRQCISRKLGEV
ncbi:RNA polymerase subunit sigma-24 [Veronia nyctiphanis]|uniref:RNA polymerase subunit sigma-24 n=1 Tax=Veronia nyctiphanis TaxID=1278244 RepID=A0A4Q0YSD6_9GAMM|nr:sigma-70 family RNA polymerase sigma factor [Veronia nyctiphanis]RXJ74140.1 RNA polymerase subunit sigma-24 [Veronia nyctiphanis]